MESCSDHDLCIERAVSRAEAICSDRGVRFTSLRRHIFLLIWSDHKPVKAYYLLDSLRGGDFCVRPPTVYRALDFLLHHGLIHRLRSLNAYIGCTHPLLHRDCYFLICVSCGMIKECCGDDVSGFVDSMALSDDFDVSGVTLEISGYCSVCKRYRV